MLIIVATFRFTSTSCDSEHATHHLTSDLLTLTSLPSTPCSAANNPDLLLLSINTFQKDLADQSPLIRSMSLRVLTSIRLPVIQGEGSSCQPTRLLRLTLVVSFIGIVMLGLNKLVKDRNPWVRKAVAGGLAKVYE